MASKTKGFLADRALKNLGVNTRFSTANPEEIADTIAGMEEWMAATSGIGKRIGYYFSSDPVIDPNQESGIPDWAELGVINSLAMYMSAYFDKQAPEDVVRNAAVGMQTIGNNTIEIAEVQYPNRMPVGRGSRWNTYGPRFYQGADRIQTSGDFLSDDGDDIITSD